VVLLPVESEESDLSKLGNLFAKFESSVKEGPWLQFVGYMLAFGGLLGHAHKFGVPLAYVGLGVSMAGFLYDKIYP